MAEKTSPTQQVTSKQALQDQLFKQIREGSLFTQAFKHASEYLHTQKDNVTVPSEDSLSLLKQFDTPLPKLTTDGHTTLSMLANLGTPNTVKYDSGRYFGFVTGGMLPIGLATRYMSDAWDQNAALHVMSPIAAKLEQVCESWLQELLDLPSTAKLGIVGGTSVATLCGLAAARFRQLSKLDYDVNKNGLFGAPKLRLIMGEQTHGTVLKMAKLLGFGETAVEWVKADDQGRIIIDDMPQLDERCIVILQAGNVCSGAFDNIGEICESAKAAGAWVHVDGAFGLWAKASSKFNKLTSGIEKAQSWSVDGHKTLNTPYDCGLILCADTQALSEALHQQGSYIQYSNARDSMMFTPDMSRRARGIDLWACLHFLGKQGVAELVEQLHNNAVLISEALEQRGFTILNEVCFNQVLVCCDTPQLTEATLVNIQASGEVWCGGANWQGKPVIRISVCSWASTQADMHRSADVFLKALNVAKSN